MTPLFGLQLPMSIWYAKQRELVIMIHTIKKNLSILDSEIAGSNHGIRCVSK